MIKLNILVHLVNNGICLGGNCQEKGKIIALFVFKHELFAPDHRADSIIGDKLQGAIIKVVAGEHFLQKAH